MLENFENEYLNRKLEPRNDLFEGQEIADYEEFGEHSYEQEKGYWEFQIGNTKISLKYSKPKLDDLLEGKYSKFWFLSILDKKQFKENEAFKELREKLNKIRLIDEMLVENKSELYNTNQIFQDGKILFNLESEESSAINLNYNEIFLTEDPLTPKGFVTILHEIGHYQDLNTGDEQTRAVIQEEYDKKNKYKTASDSIWESKKSINLNEDDAASVLMRERSAWAFALKDLKPYIKDLKINTENLKNFIHGGCLESYSTNIRNTIEYNSLLKEGEYITKILEEELAKRNLKQQE